VRDGLDDVHVAHHALLEHVGGVAGRAEAHDLELRLLVDLDVVLELLQQLLRVEDRVPLGELVRLHQDAPALVVDENRFAGG